MDLLLLNNSNLNIVLYEKRLEFRLRVIHRNLPISQSAMGIAVFIVFIAMDSCKGQTRSPHKCFPNQSPFSCSQISSLHWAQETNGANDMAIAAGWHMTESDQWILTAWDVCRVAGKKHYVSSGLVGWDHQQFPNTRTKPTWKELRVRKMRDGKRSRVASWEALDSAVPNWT